ncbi:MAG: hypothetical protein AB2385_04825 [Symbiobacterium sp.]|uniref:hypothetical protein n=1 Tax=Symbiobacterium sp. TaxID=1971213 RepID=UPI0034645A87
MSVQVMHQGSSPRRMLTATTALLVVQQLALWDLNDQQFRLLYALIFLATAAFLGDGHSRYAVLAGPVLRVAFGLQREPIPLAGAEVKALRNGWQLRWSDGRTVRRLSLDTPEDFREAVERAVERARTAEPGSVPRTPREAAEAVPVFQRTALRERWLALALLVVAVTLLSLWLNHPAPLFAVPVLIWFQDRIFAGTTLLLCDGTLWFLGEQEPVYQVPLAHVRSVEPRGRRQVLLRLDDARFPTLKLVRYHGGVDALAVLQRAVGGEPLLLPDRAGAGRPASGAGPSDGGKPFRCALCGRPVPGSPAPGAIHICERCQHKVRYEAEETGHGLKGKEPKPM